MLRPHSLWPKNPCSCSRRRARRIFRANCGDPLSSANKKGRLISTNSMNYSFQLSSLGRADQKAFFLLLEPPERPRHCPPLIPGGDQYSSRGQRPRKTSPPQDTTLKGSNTGGATSASHATAQGHATPSGSGKERRALRALPPATTLCPCGARKSSPSILRRGARF
jgi:hypothetical protein